MITPLGSRYAIQGALGRSVKRAAAAGLNIYDTFTRADGSLDNSSTEDGGFTWTAPQFNIVDGLAINTPVLEATNYVDNPGFDSDTLWSKSGGWTIGSGMASFTTTAGYLSQTTSRSFAGKFVKYGMSRVGNITQPTVGGFTGDSGGTIGGVLALNSQISIFAHPVWGNTSVDNVWIKEVTKANACAILDSGVSDVSVELSYASNGQVMSMSGLILNADNITNPSNYLLVVCSSNNDNGHTRVIAVKDNVGVSTLTIFPGPYYNTAYTLTVTKSLNSYEIVHSKFATPYNYTLTDPSSLITNNTIHGIMSLTSLAKYSGITIASS